MLSSISARQRLQFFLVNNVEERTRWTIHSPDTAYAVTNSEIFSRASFNVLTAKLLDFAPLSMLLIKSFPPISVELGMK